jgi:hypothetical protein
MGCTVRSGLCGHKERPPTCQHSQRVRVLYQPQTQDPTHTVQCSSSAVPAQPQLRAGYLTGVMLNETGQAGTAQRTASPITNKVGVDAASQSSTHIPWTCRHAFNPQSNPSTSCLAQVPWSQENIWLHKSRMSHHTRTRSSHTANSLAAQTHDFTPKCAVRYCMHSCDCSATNTCSLATPTTEP